MEDTYRTIEEMAESVYTEKRSKFIAIALPVRTLTDVKNYLFPLAILKPWLLPAANPLFSFEEINLTESLK